MSGSMLFLCLCDTVVLLNYKKVQMDGKLENL